MTLTKTAVSLAITDFAALALIFVLPALSHLTSVPFYLADPMRLAVLGALIASRNWKNSLALALALPLVSFALSGHPVYPKCLIIAAELAVNVALFAWFSRLIKRRRSDNSRPTWNENGRFCSRSAISRPTWNTAALFGGAAFLSILLSKVLYYALKALVLSAGLLKIELVSTALWIQLVVAVLLSVGIAVRFSKSA